MDESSTPSAGGLTDQKWFRASAIFLAVVVIGAVILAWAPWVSNDDDTTGTGGEVGASAPASPGSESKCGLAPGDQSLPTVSGPEVTWELIGRIAAPTDPSTLGPGEVTDGLRSCYPKSPTGALMAAANFTVQASNPELAMQNLKTNVAPGKGQDILIANLSSNTSSIGGNDSVSVQIAGFKFIEFTGDTTLVEIVSRGSNGAIISTPLGMVWHDGDWKVAVQDNGQPAVPSRELKSLNGYVSWAGA